MTMRRHAFLCVVATIILTDAVMAQEEALGRLFYTPEQRAALNANIRSVTDKPKEAIPVAPSVTLSGVVTRSDGERTVWVDGRAYHQGNPAGVRVITKPGDPGGVELKVRGVRQHREVRVGQRLDPTTGNTFEPYEAPRPVAPAKNQAPATPDIGAETAKEKFLENK